MRFRLGGFRDADHYLTRGTVRSGHTRAKCTATPEKLRVRNAIKEQ
jgi:hypothetical protein